MTGWKTPSIADIIEGAPVLAGGPVARASALFEDPEDFEGREAPAPPPDANIPLETLAHCASLEQNDTDNGARLITHFGADLLHVREVGWHVWDERVWKREGGDETVQRLAQKTAKRIHLEADLLELQPWEVEAVEKAKPFRAKDKGDLTDDEAEAIRVADGCKRALGKRRSGRRDFAVTSGNGGRVAAMVAQALPHKTVGPTQLDADEMRFACQNGTLRFERVEDDDNVGDHAANWKLKVTPEPHTRGHLITKLAPATYDPAAKCPTWDAFMERFQPDPEIRKFLQIYHGLSLTGQTGHQCFLYLYGTGANGKSTFVEALAHVFGPYSDLLNAESISGQGQRRGDQATPDFAELPGVRYLRISELPRGEGLKEALIKALTGGEPIKARHLNKGFFSFTPSFKAVMSGNDLPQIGGLDLGIWRRVKLVPWQVTIPDGERRPMAEVLAEFEAERSGILNWLIAGLDLYMREGLETPKAVADATADYRSEMDPIGAFAKDCIVPDTRSKVSARDLYNAFVDWCDANSVRPWKETMFGRAMPTKGYKREDGRVRFYLDIALHPDRPIRAEPRSPMGGGSYGA